MTDNRKEEKGLPGTANARVMPFRERMDGGRKSHHRLHSTANRTPTYIHQSDQRLKLLKEFGSFAQAVWLSRERSILCTSRWQGKLVLVVLLPRTKMTFCTFFTLSSKTFLGPSTHSCIREKEAEAHEQSSRQSTDKKSENTVGLLHQISHTTSQSFVCTVGHLRLVDIGTSCPDSLDERKKNTEKETND